MKYDIESTNVSIKCFSDCNRLELDEGMHWKLFYGE